MVVQMPSEKLSRIFSALQVVFCTKKQDLIVRKCSDKSTYLRPSEVPLGTAAKPCLGCGICSRIKNPLFYFWLILVLYYSALYFCAENLAFPICKDELHFWPTSIKFSHTYLPSLDLLKNYGELNTPIPFMIFGLIEKIWAKGIVYGRLFNFLTSIAIAFIVGFPGFSRNPKKSMTALVIILASPYFIGLSTHLYTDLIAVFFALCGCLLHEKNFFKSSVLCFILAISSRQYMVAFPCALALFEIWHKPTCKIRWIAPVIACLSLICWVIFWGGLGPQAEVHRQAIVTSRIFYLIPENCIYFLAGLGVYFCIPEIIIRRLSNLFIFTAGARTEIYPKKSKIVTATHDLRTIIARKEIIAGLMLGVLFYIYPPIQNHNSSIPTMGFIDKTLHLLNCSSIRMILLYLFALLATVRFLKIDRNFFLVWVNVLMMLKAHIAWDKYVIPLVIILCFYYARED